jgi:hypothetical protein
MVSPETQLGGICGVSEYEVLLKSEPPPPPPSQSSLLLSDVDTDRNLGASFPPLAGPAVARLLAGSERWRFGVVAGVGAALLLLVGLPSSGDEAVGGVTAVSPALGEVVTSMSQRAGDELVASRDKALANVEPETPKESAPAPVADEEEDAGGSSKGAAVKKATSSSSAPFNRDAARSAVFSAAANASGCRTKRGPKGRGKAAVTVGPSGRVQGVSISGPFGGTKVGRCVARVFRSVRVPAFSGSPVTLTKSFTIR